MSSIYKINDASFRHRVSGLCMEPYCAEYETIVKCYGTKIMLAFRLCAIGFLYTIITVENWICLLAPLMNCRNIQLDKAMSTILHAMSATHLSGLGLSTNHDIITP